MLKYHPSKSQFWGHRVGKLSAVQLLERSERFLREQTVPARGGEAMSTLSIGWVHDGSDALPQRVEVLRGALAATARLSQYRGAIARRGVAPRGT